MDTIQLIEKCKNRDSYAEREFFVRYAQKVFRLCRRYSNDDHQAKDFLQDSFISIFENLKSFNPDKGSIEGWMYRVATNTILQQKRKSRKFIISLSDEKLPEQAIEKEELDRLSDEELLNSLRQLPSGYREILNLYIFENWSHAEISSMMGIKESASRSQLSRAKKLLKKLLIQSIPDIYERKLV